MSSPASACPTAPARAERLCGAGGVGRPRRAGAGPWHAAFAGYRLAARPDVAQHPGAAGGRGVARQERAGRSHRGLRRAAPGGGRRP
ncbi:hypothetical protein G6F46_013757 [Rhizopus delemar]|nr:hypothetical protein G6F46_013757 [Rhizopus delemar]